jgi:hypothetical protein
MAHRGDGGQLWVECMKAVLELLLLGERLMPPKWSAINSKLSRRMVSLRKKPPHVKHSPSAEKVSVDEGTIRMSRGKAHYKSPFIRC